MRPNDASGRTTTIHAEARRAGKVTATRPITQTTTKRPTAAEASAATTGITMAQEITATGKLVRVIRAANDLLLAARQA